MDVQATALVSGGQIVIEIDPVPAGLVWEIERVRIWCSSTLQTHFALYANDPTNPAKARTVTDIGNDNLAWENPPIRVNSNDRLIGVWEGCSATDSSGEPTRAYLAMQIAERRR